MQLQGPSEQKPIKKFREKGPWAYPETPQFLGVPPKIGESLDTPMVPFLELFSWVFARMDPVNVSAEYEVRYFTRLLPRDAWCLSVRLSVRLSVCL